MRRAAVLAGIVLLVGGLVQVFGSRAPEPGARSAVDLSEARKAFASGEVERARSWATTLSTLEPPPLAWLREGLRDADRSVREWSAHVLGDVAPADAESIAALMRAFEDEDDWVRWKAARALGNIGPAARAALPLLDRAASDVREEVVHAAAQKAVRQIRADG